MTKQEAIEKIKEIMEEVSESWLANDGGLTMAASDVLAFGRYVVEDIKKGQVKRIMGLDPFDCSTGAEQDIVCIAQEWAEETKTRRRIEERLRKDERFYEKIKTLMRKKFKDFKKGNFYEFPLGDLPLAAYEVLKCSVATGHFRKTGAHIFRSCTGIVYLAIPEKIVEDPDIQTIPGIKREFLPKDERLY